ncbi:MAG: 2-C-methyl-D-erythritol 4-phosphate cytidylyltransferase [Gammaproteobacteria bacterium]|nr:2-C-methyl-D-erythritol 4-phosphate cytidylyltransferase [Gammaproteobacteria bacterium]
MTSTNLWCVVPAAGVGKRFGSALPKQYLPLLDQTVCEHTLDRLLQLREIRRIVVSLSAEDTQFSKLSIANNPRIHTTLGGAERCHSVLNGLKALQPDARDSDWVLVHDVARPCLRPDDVRKLLQQVEVAGAIGGILANPVRDTMKRSNAQNRILETVCRNQLWHALTPQLFRLGQLRDGLESALAENALVTDEASALERAGHQPLLVEGHPDNIKITHPQDLPLAALFIQQQRVQPLSNPQSISQENP